MSGEGTITLVGGVTADPVQRNNDAQNPWVTFGLAVTPRRFDKTANDWVDGVTAYWPCSANGRVAKQVLIGLGKGTQVVVVGLAGQRNWEKDGVKQSHMEVTVLAVGVQPRLDAAGPQTQKAGPAATDEPWATSANYSDETPF